jgi:hypothetical protein
VIHLVAIGLLTALVALQAVERLEAGSVLALPAAAVVGLAAGLAYRRLAPVRTFVTILAPVPLVFLALFLFASPVAKITLAPEAEAHAAAVSARTPVVVVVFDELPLVSLLDADGTIDEARYPNFSALALGSTWFRRTLSVSGSTTEAVPALLTGKRPDPDRLPFFADHRDSLFTLLAGSYRLAVVEPITKLCPADLCPESQETTFLGRQRRLFSDAGVIYGHVLLPDDLRARLPSISSTWMDFRNNALYDMKNRDEEFRAFVGSITPTPRPTLWFLHTLLPHHPWRYLPSGAEYSRAAFMPGLTGDRWDSDRVLVAQAHQRHLLQLGFVDRLLGELLARLHETELYDRSLVVVTADHGVSFRPNGDRRRLTEANVAEVGLVPLFVKAPHQRSGRVVETLTHTTEVLPIVAEALGVDVPWPVDRSPSVSHGGLERQRGAALRRQAALFRSGLYRVGPHSELLGRSASELMASDSEVVVELSDPELFENFGSGALTPAHVVGVLEGRGAEPELDVAVAVNRTIAATARTFSFAGNVRFEAIVPESAFRQGRNIVDVYVISSTGELLKTRGRP